ncbi:MAG TPA: hypothetical protein DIC64_04885 [Alphaproteobacteria bacterium]|nr:hypothetical protein [Alphaproteobacteria bacterium]
MNNPIHTFYDHFFIATPPSEFYFVTPRGAESAEDKGATKAASHALRALIAASLLSFSGVSL